MRIYKDYAMVMCTNCDFRMPIAKGTAKIEYVEMMFCVNCDTDHCFKITSWTEEDKSKYDRDGKGY